MRATIVHAVVWFALAIARMPTSGAEGVGVGCGGAARVDAALFAHYTKREVQLPILASLASPTSAAAIAVALAWWLATASTAHLSAARLR